MLDMVSLLVGIVVGTAIFRASPGIFADCGSATVGMLMWAAGAVIALCGALCYSEMAAAWPRFGAEYVFLSEAYGKRMGILFAWMQVFAVVTGNIGAMAFAFADYAGKVLNLEEPTWELPTLAAAAVTISWLIHMCGMSWGRMTQNALSVCKIASLVLILICGVIFTGAAESPVVPASEPAVIAEATSPSLASLGTALLFVLFTYGGWNDATAVTPDVRDCRRKVPRALILGLALIAVLYLAVNAAYLRVLGYPGLVASKAPAADVFSRVLGQGAARALSLLVMFSALGAIHGMLLTGCRTLEGVGTDVPLFAKLSQRSTRGAAVLGLTLLAGIALTMILLVGTSQGQQLLTGTAGLLGVQSRDFSQKSGFGVLVDSSSAVFYIFYMLTAVAVFVLRWKAPDQPRPFRIPLFPLPPLIFLAATVWILWSAVTHALDIVVLMLPIGVLGVLAALLLPLRKREEGVWR